MGERWVEKTYVAHFKPVMSISKSSSVPEATNIVAGNSITYTITANNSSSKQIDSVYVYDAVPAGLTDVQVVTSPYEYSAESGQII